MSARDTPRRPGGEGEGAAKRCPPQVALAGIRVVTYLVQNASLSLSPATASAEGHHLNGGPFPATVWAEGYRAAFSTSARHQFNGAPFPATVSAEGRQFNGAPSPGSTQRIGCALEEPYATTVRLHRSGTYGEAHGDTAARGRLHGGGP